MPNNAADSWLNEKAPEYLREYKLIAFDVDDIGGLAWWLKLTKKEFFQLRAIVEAMRDVDQKMARPAEVRNDQ